MLNDPEFAKNVKGLEGMLRVRERLGESSRVCVPAPNSALHSGRRDAGSVAPGFAVVAHPVLRRTLVSSRALIVTVTWSRFLRSQVRVENLDCLR